MNTTNKREKIGCGCCKGPEADRCCCHMHQDISRGLRAKVCSHHAPKAADPGLSPSTVDISTITEYGITQKLSNSIRCF